MANELREAMLQADADENVRAIVLTGAGRGFCAGADMARLSSAAAGKSTLRNEGNWPTEGLEANFAQRCSYVLGVKKPTIAGINGPVAGIGLVITLYCDIRYMAAGTKLTTAFARRGLIAEHGVAWMLPRLIGPMHALDLLYSARAVPAEEAGAMGLVRVLPAEGFAAAVHERASEIANLSSPRSTRIMKKQVYDGLFQSLAEATAIANREQETCRDTADFREGVAHYLEKRKPNFTGR
jgi:enoyl-CoA hydratase/carnithine racemase